MKHFLWAMVLVFLAAAPAWSGPNFVPLNKPPSTTGGTVLFVIGDTSDSPAIGVSGYCTVRYQQSSGDDAALYAVTSSTSSTSSGTLLTTFSSSTSPTNPAYTFTASTQWVKAKATDATAGGSVMIIECNPTFGSSGGAPLVEYAALGSIDETRVSHVTVTDCDDLTCASPGGGTTDVPFYYNGSAWVPFPGAAAGIASVQADNAPILGGDLDAANKSITGVSTLQVNDQPVYYVEAYAPGAWTAISSAQRLTAISDALTACDTAAEASDMHGIVKLPRGKTVLDLSSGTWQSPLIELPTNTGAGGENASCDLVGWGSIKDYSPGGSVDPVGSSIYAYNTDNMTADATGRKVVMFSPGHGQVLRDFNIIVSGAASTSVDGTTLLLAASADNDGAGADAFGDDGIKRASFDRLVLSSAYLGYGVLFESIFFLDSAVTNSNFSGGSSGWLLTSQSGTANNANLIQGNRFVSNTVAIDIPGILSCQDLYLHRNTMESNVYGIRLRSGSTCRVYSFQNHWEQLYTGGSQVGVNDVLIEDASPQFFSFGDFWDSLFNATAATSAVDHIERTVANASTNPPDMVLGGSFRDNEDIIYTYAAGGRIVVNEDYRAATLGLPRSADCAVAPYTTNGVACVDSDDESLWISGVAIATGDVTQVGDCTTGACFEGAGSESTIKAIGNVLIDLDDDNNTANSHFYVRTGTNAAVLDVDELGNALALTSFYSPSIQGATEVIVGEDTTTTGVLRFFHSDGGAQTFTPPAGAGSLAYTLPANDGAAGEQLTSDGSGGLSWANPAGVASGDPAMFFGNDVTNTAGFAFDAGRGLAGTFTANASPTPSDSGLEFDFSLAYASLTGASNGEECYFTKSGTGAGGFVCEGQTANGFEYYFTFPSMAELDADAEKFIVTTDATQTLTEKTFNAESSGNVLTTVEKVWFPASGCNNATPTPFYDLPTSSAAEAGCITGTNTQKGVLDFDQTVSESAQVTHLLPSDWTGTVDVKLKWLTTYTSSSVAWQVATSCVADAETDDPSFNTASEVVDATKGTTNQTNDASITGLTVTGCAAGELLHLKVSRDPTNVSDATLADARLIGFELTYRRAI